MNPSAPEKIEYQASSPDELALIQGAVQAGFKLKHRDGRTITVENVHTRRDQVFEIHAEFPFDSDRKRMSLLVEEKAYELDEESRYTLMSKGADSIMIPRSKFSNKVI